MNYAEVKDTATSSFGVPCSMFFIFISGFYPRLIMYCPFGHLKICAHPCNLCYPFSNSSVNIRNY